MLHETCRGIMLDFCVLMFDIIYSDLIFSVVDENLDRLSDFQYRDRAGALVALFNTRTRG